MQKVLFSFHAAQRMQQRLKISVPTKDDVNISSAFFKSKTHFYDGQMCEFWASRDPATPVVLVIAQTSKVVLTVLLGSELLGKTAAFTDSCMRGTQH